MAAPLNLAEVMRGADPYQEVVPNQAAILAFIGLSPKLASWPYLGTP